MRRAATDRRIIPAATVNATCDGAFASETLLARHGIQYYSAPELSKLIRAANAVLNTQESTLLRAVTKRFQVVNGEKSRKSRVERKTGQALSA